MNGILVAHAKNPNFGFKAAGPDPKFPEDFTLVATVAVPVGQEDTSPETLADIAFRDTNHIESSWTENESVTLLDGDQHRSTSCGDVVVTPDGSVMLCEDVGWKKIGTHIFNEEAA